MVEAWLKCVVFKGMFSDELAVKYQPRRGDPSSFFVPREKVQGEEGEGKLRVTVFKKDDVSWAILPTENRTIIPIDEADLVTQ
jgi:hypothetical protein